MKVDQKVPDFRSIYQNGKTTLRKKYPLSADISLKVEVLVTLRNYIVFTNQESDQ